MINAMNSMETLNDCAAPYDLYFSETANGAFMLVTDLNTMEDIATFPTSLNVAHSFLKAYKIGYNAAWDKQAKNDGLV